jgi:hypothetical protein
LEAKEREQANKAEERAKKDEDIEEIYQQRKKAELEKK